METNTLNNQSREEELQAMNGDLHLQELRQRINAKAASLLKMRLKTEKVSRWKRIAVIALCVILLAFLVWSEVYFYGSIIFWGLNAFIVVYLIGYFVMHRIMRHFLTRMKNAGTAPQHYRAVKQFLITYKIRHWIPLVTAIVCSLLVICGSELWPFMLIWGIIMAVGQIWGDWSHNWYLDEDFCADVEELGNYE